MQPLMQNLSTVQSWVFINVAIVASGISLAFDIELRVIMDDVQSVRQHLLDKLESLEEKKTILRAPELRDLYNKVKDQPEDKRAEFGQAVNALKSELEDLVNQLPSSNIHLPDIDVTAPMDVNSEVPQLIPTASGTIHPISQELEVIVDIFSRMGFEVVESPQLDDDYHMFTSLNFPENHPARDDYDTFLTQEVDKNGHPYVAPAHASVMQNRLLRKFKDNLKRGLPIAAMYTGRNFRNEDLDARHEHTFHQVEFMFVSQNITVGNLIATLKTLLEEYYGQDLDVRTTPFYFPFTEPSFELALSCPFCKKKGCKVCSQEGWIELLGCGMIHPNVLKMGGVDPVKYTGFAAGRRLKRLFMMKNNSEDIRHFNSGKLKVLRQFK